MRKSKPEATVPFTIEAVLKFVSKQYHIREDSLTGSNGRYKDGPVGFGDLTNIIVQRDGKNFLEVFRLSDKGKELRFDLAGLIERDELISTLEEVPMEEVFAILARHVDLKSLSGWVSSASNHDVRIMAGSSHSSPDELAAFWELWNQLGLKPKVRLKGRDMVAPSFTMMKQLQAARSSRLASDLAASLLDLLGGDFMAACGIIMQECRSFDWPAVIDDLVAAGGGGEGWMDPSSEAIGGLLICPIG